MSIINNLELDNNYNIVLEVIKSEQIRKQDIDAIFGSKELDNNIEINNTDKIQFIDCKKNILIDWLVSEKSFNRDRITKQLEDIN